MAATTACPGCFMTRPASGTAYDRKFNASAECWAVFEEVIAVEFQSPAIFGRAHQITVDAYAVQHAGGRHPDKSVCVHLIGLYLAMDRGVKPVEIAPRLQRFASRAKEWPHFEVPADRAAVTVEHVVLASGAPDDHIRRVHEWGTAVWNSWKIHHDAVRRIAAGI